MIFAVFNKKTRRQDSRSGFSVVELMIVVAVMICITVVALPNMLHVIASVRTRSTMSSLSGLIQECRSLAIKTNKVMTVHFTVQSGQPVAYIEDANAPAALSSAQNNKVIFLGGGVTKYTAPAGSDAPPALTGSQLWGSNWSGTPNTTDVSFNSRGLPCVWNDTTKACDVLDAYQNSIAGFVYYFTYAPPYGANGWTGISVSPAGRVRGWFWNGTAWGN